MKNAILSIMCWCLVSAAAASDVVSTPSSAAELLAAFTEAYNRGDAERMASLVRIFSKNENVTEMVRTSFGEEVEKKGSEIALIGSENLKYYPKEMLTSIPSEVSLADVIEVRHAPEDLGDGGKLRTSRRYLVGVESGQYFIVAP